MEISDEKLTNLIEGLKKVNNSTEDEIMALADRVIALKMQLCWIDNTLGDLAMIVKQAKEPPSLPPQ